MFLLKINKFEIAFLDGNHKILCSEKTIDSPVLTSYYISI